MATQTGHLFVKLSMQSKDFVAGLKAAQTKTQQFVTGVKTLSTGVAGKLTSAFSTFGGVATKILGGVFNVLGSILTKIWDIVTGILKWGTVMGAALLGFTLKRAIEEFGAFEREVLNVRKISSESFDTIRDKLLQLPPALGTLAQTAQGYYMTLSAGIKGEKEQLDFLQTALQLSKSAHLDQAEAVEGLAKLMRVYGDELGTTTAAADKLYAIEKVGITEVAKLVPVLGDISKMSNEMNLSVNEMAGAFALLTQTTKSTNTASTELVGVMRSLMVPNEKLTEIYEKLNVQSGEMLIKKYGLVGALEKLERAAQNSNLRFTDLFSDVEAKKGVISLAANDFGQLKGSIDEVTKSTGGAQVAYREWAGGLEAHWSAFKTATSRIWEAIGEAVEGPLKRLLAWGTSWLENNREFVRIKAHEYVEKLVGAYERLVEWYEKASVAIMRWWKNLDITEYKVRFLAFLEDVKRALAWVWENAPAIAKKLQEIISAAAKVVEYITSLKQKVTDLFTIKLETVPLKDALQDIGDNLLDTGKKADTAAKEIKKSFDNIKPEVTVKFRGHGSDVKPIMEKIGEINTGLRGMTSEWGHVADKIGDTIPSLRIDPREALIAISMVNQELEGFYENYVSQINKYIAASARVLGPSALTNKIKRMYAKMAEDAYAEMNKVISSISSWWQQKLNAKPDPYMKGMLYDASKGAHGLSPMSTYGPGGGGGAAAQSMDLSILSGMTRGIASIDARVGEIASAVVPYMRGKQNESAFRGTPGGPPAKPETGDTFNITIAPLIMTGDQHSLRKAAEAMEPELRRLAKRWA